MSSIPLWMLNTDACARMRLEQKVRVHWSALFELYQLLGAVRLAATPTVDVRAQTSQDKAHETGQSSSTLQPRSAAPDESSGETAGSAAGGAVSLGRAGGACSTDAPRTRRKQRNR